MPPLAQAQVRPTDSLTEVVRRYEQHGFPSQFAARPGGNVRCLACHRDHPARWVGLLGLHRLERASKPGDEVAVAAVECPACEERGILALAFGSAAPVEDKLVLSLLDDRREESVLEIGLRVGV
ncbi:MAG: hypothetical protein QOJ26_11 [Thermoplasmata archaeon]|jgi:hypothetical protein|nr:hypothetical protein [Thermoplasmata archaeon]MEA3165167.1 hypothetical protein [Thermoplasmata archaeon]